MDDSTLTSTKKQVSEINAEMNDNCTRVTNWMNENKLCLNAGKTHLMVAGTSQRLARLNVRETVDIQMDNIKLTESEEGFETILGVHLQPNLKWNTHILLQVLENKAAQLVLNTPPRTSRKEMYDRLGWMSVNQLIFYHTVISVYKIRKSMEPEYLAAKLTNDNFRSTLVVPNTILSLAKNSFCYRAPESWNKVPESVRKIENVSRKNSENGPRAILEDFRTDPRSMNQLPP